jgi:hypothetical protein
MPKHEAVRAERVDYRLMLGGREVTRLEGFSDAVFAGAT